MKIFTDYKAKKRYTELYEMLEENQRSEFAERIRELADSKIISLDDNLTDFYINAKDVDSCFKEIK